MHRHRQGRAGWQSRNQRALSHSFASGSKRSRGRCKRLLHQARAALHRRNRQLPGETPSGWSRRVREQRMPLRTMGRTGSHRRSRAWLSQILFSRTRQIHVHSRISRLPARHPDGFIEIVDRRRELPLTKPRKTSASICAALTIQPQSLVVVCNRTIEFFPHEPDFAADDVGAGEPRVEFDQFIEVGNRFAVFSVVSVLDSAVEKPRLSLRRNRRRSGYRRENLGKHFLRGRDHGRFRVIKRMRWLLRLHGFDLGQSVV